MGDVFQLPGNYDAVEASGYFKPPVGSYEFTCFAAAIKSIGDKQALVLNCRINKGEYTGREMGPQNLFIGEKSIWKLKQLNQVLHLNPSAGGQMSASWYVGRIFIATVEHSDDGKYANFGSFAEAAAGSGLQPGPAPQPQSAQPQVFAQQPQVQVQPQVYAQPQGQVVQGQPLPVDGVRVQRGFPPNAG